MNAWLLRLFGRLKSFRKGRVRLFPGITQQTVTISAVDARRSALRVTAITENAPLSATLMNSTTIRVERPASSATIYLPHHEPGCIVIPAVEVSRPLWHEDSDGEVWSLSEMAWSKPQFSRGQVDAAGRILAPLTHEGAPDIDSHEWFVRWEQALAVINNWRSAHSYPLLATRMTLNTGARKIDDRAVVAQRLKRLTSIQTKLFRNEKMAFSRMQDIGGCRAILKTVPRVDRLVKVYEDVFAKNPSVRTEFVKKYDYIAEPKVDGYRSVHFVVKYRTKSKHYLPWNGLRIEIQIRSRLQHAWATAVETVDTFTHQSLKTGGGIESWRRFFVLMGSAIAIMENRPLCPGCPADVSELKKELREAVHVLNVRPVLRGWSSAMNYLPSKTVSGGAAVYLLYLDPAEEKVKVTGFSSAEQAKASEVYLSTEKMIRDKGVAQAVLVSVESIQTLRTAFPNYFADTRVFLGAVQRALVL